MELVRRYIGLNRRKGGAVSQITLEEDLNVPDQKPDIFRIIHKQGEFRADEIKGEIGKIKVRGVFFYRILYVGEGADRMPDALEGSVPVEETVFLNELEDGDGLDFSWELEDLHASAIHSRKVNMKCVLALKAEAYREQPAALVGAPPEEKDLFIRTCPVSVQQETVHKKDTLRIREELTLPPGKPNIRKIIWKELRLQGLGIRPEEGKVIIKGELSVFFLYEGEAEDVGRLQWLEQSIPFQQEIECEGCRPDLTGKTEVSLQRADMELQADYDGEPRTVRIDAVLELRMRYLEESSGEVLCDAYSLDREIHPVRQTYAWDFVQGISDARARAGGRLKLEEGAPSILQILSAGAQIHAGHMEISEKGLQVQGMTEPWVLYTTSDDAQPVACVMGSFPFDYTVETSELSENSGWQVSLGLDQITVNMQDEREVEIKMVLQIQALFQCQRELDLVEDLEEEPLDMERLKRMPGMVIHVVQSGESLWDIAREHAASCAAVAELNELKEEAVRPGQKLLLIKEISGRGNGGTV